MREILFRGKRTKNGEWVYGVPTKDEFDATYIVRGLFECDEYKCTGADSFDVIPESISEFTGLTDKNGKKIFEGDIVKVQDDIFGSPFCNGLTGKVVYDETAFFIEPQNPMESQWLFNECAVYEIIGNIHDNPELLKGE